MQKEDYTEEQWAALSLTEKKQIIGKAKHPLKGFGSWDKDRLKEHNKEMARRSVEARRVKHESAQEN